MAKIYRDAGNGQFVKKEEVKKRPGTTVTETVKPKPKSTPKKK
ncbi:hypothetical protein [Chryseobacterium ginsengisoli]